MHLFKKRFKIKNFEKIDDNLGGKKMQGFTWIDTAVLVIYLLGVLFAGLWFSNKEHQGKEFFKGDGTIPWWVTCVSIFATLLSNECVI